MSHNVTLRGPPPPLTFDVIYGWAPKRYRGGIKKNKERRELVRNNKTLQCLTSSYGDMLASSRNWDTIYRNVWVSVGTTGVRTSIARTCGSRVLAFCRTLLPAAADIVKHIVIISLVSSREHPFLHMADTFPSKSFFT